MRIGGFRVLVLAIVVAALSGVSSSAATPTIYRGDNPHQDANWKRHLRELQGLHPGAEALKRVPPASPPQKRGGPEGTSAPSPEAYNMVGLGFSEGWADHVATNGKVACWSNDTLLGNFTFAPVGDVAHPTAYFVGYGFAPTYGDSMQFAGDRLYVDNGGTDVLEFDCANANDIHLVADYDVSCYVNPYGASGGKIEDFRVKNGHLWVALGSEGFLVYALGNPSYPVLYGNPVNECENYGLYAFDPSGSIVMYCMHIEVTDDTMILIDDTPGYGLVYLWDITNMVDPLHTVLPYPGSETTNRYRLISDCQSPPVTYNVALFGSIDLGFPYIESTYSGGGYHGIQVKFISGSLFVSNSLFNADLGLARFDWADESVPDTLLAAWGSPFSINNAGPPFGRPRHLNNFAVADGGAVVYVSYEDVYDSSGYPDIRGDSGEKWNWSTFVLPSSLLTYKMDRFFFNTQTNFHTDPLGYDDVFYGGACIAFAASPSGAARAFIAGWNFVGAFDDSGQLADHYVTGMDPEWWPLVSFHTPWFAYGANPNSQNYCNMPASASVFNFVRTGDDAHTVIWEPEGFAVMDNASGLRVGFWECPNRQDFVRSVALTSNGQYAFVTCGALGLMIVDILNRAHPVTAGTWWTNPAAPAGQKQPVTFAFLNGDYAYVQTRALAVDAQNPHANINVLRVLDITTPELPAEVASYEAAVGPYGGVPPSTIYWDVNHMQLADAYAAQGREFIQISNGQGIPLGMPLEAWRPAFSNNIEYDNYSPGAVGSFVIGDISTPGAIANRFDASRQAVSPIPTLLPGTYCFMSAFVSPPENAGYWAYVADGFAEIVDMGDPASGLIHTHVTPFGPASFFPDPYAYGTPFLFGGLLPFPTYVSKIFRVRGASQLGTGYFFLDPTMGAADAWDHWDISLPLTPFSLVPYGTNSTFLTNYGSWFGQLSDATWLSTTSFGDVFFFSNRADYIAPAFTTAGPNGDGWLTPYCGSTQCGVISGPMDLRVQVVDNVAVTRVRMRAYLDNGDHWDGCEPGYIALGNALGPDSDYNWTLTIDPSQFDWTGWVIFRATANDAGGNMISQYNYGGDWLVLAPPSVDVLYGGQSYVWSTAAVSARVATVAGDSHIARVLFKVDGLAIGDGVYNPAVGLWVVNWNTTLQADGLRNVTAEVTTGLGAVAASQPRGFYVANSGPPSSLVSPSSGQQVSGTISVSAQVDTADPVPVARVDFYLDSPPGDPTAGLMIGTSTTGVSGLYSVTWDSGTTTPGNHSVLALVTDVRWNGSSRSKASDAVSFARTAGFVGEASGPGLSMTAFKDAGSSVQVAYTPGCLAQSHAVYYGTGPIVGSLQWSGAACSPDISGHLAFDPGTPGPGGLTYFVVVAQGAATEGSYGKDSTGVERPEAVGVGACDKPQSLTGTCP